MVAVVYFAGQMVVISRGRDSLLGIRGNGTRDTRGLFCGGPGFSDTERTDYTD